MNFVKNISVADIKVKIKTLEVLVSESQEQIAHLKYTLSVFADGNEITKIPFQQENTNLTVKEAILKALKQEGVKLHRKNIFKNAQALGMTTTEGGFNVSLSQLITKNHPNIKRLGDGFYKYKDTNNELVGREV